MPPLTIIFIIAAVLCTFAIAAGVVGREAHRLDGVAPRVVYMEDQALSFVSQHLPPETQARLTLDELSQLLTFHLRWLHAKGLQPDQVIDRPQDIDHMVVVEGDDVAAYIIGEAERNNVAVMDDVDVVHVVDAHQQYFDAIGAVGPLAVDVPLD